jgi:glycosyltransferase involved in cell wall biosynthesis
MKILFVTATYKPSINGISVALDNVAKKLRKLGHKVYILAPEHKKSRKNEKYVIRYPALPNPKKFDYPIPLLPLTLNDIKMLWKIDFDIVHAHHPMHIFTMADLIAKVHNCPTVFTFHTNYDLYLNIYLKILPKKVNKIWLENTIERISKKADLIIVPSKAVRKKVLETHPKAHVKVLTTGVELNKKILPKNTAKKNLKWPLDKKALLCLSRISKEKNIVTAIEAMKYLGNDYRLYIAGSGLALSDLKKLTQSSGLAKKVKFLGEIPHEKIDRYFNAADAFLFPSITETQGLAVFEAAAMHTPIAAIKSEVADEFLKEAGAEISLNDPKLFAKAIEDLSQRDQAKLEKTIAKWISRYSFDNYVDNLVDLYQGL